MGDNVLWMSVYVQNTISNVEYYYKAARECPCPSRSLSLSHSHTLQSSVHHYTVASAHTSLHNPLARAPHVGT